MNPQAPQQPQATSKPWKQRDHEHPNYRQLMANCESIRGAFNTIAQLCHEIVATNHPEDQVLLLEYQAVLKPLYERWERERRKIVLPHWADRSAPMISTIAGFADGQQPFVQPPRAIMGEIRTPKPMSWPTEGLHPHEKKVGLENVKLRLSSNQWVVPKEYLEKQAVGESQQPATKSYTRVG